MPEGPAICYRECLKDRETVTVISELENQIIYEENIPEDWKDSFIINSCKGKGDATYRENYRGLKLLEHVMNVLERVTESLIHSQVGINKMQFGLTPGHSTTDAIHML